MTEDQTKFFEAAKAACEKYGKTPLAMLESKWAGQDSGWMDFDIQRWSLVYSGEADYDMHRELDGFDDHLCFPEADCKSVVGMVAEIMSSDNADVFYATPEIMAEITKAG